MSQNPLTNRLRLKMNTHRKGSLLAGLKRRGKAFADSKPGSRFVEEYHRHRDGAPSLLARVLSVGAGVAITLVGLVMLPAPGPGVLVVAFGAALLARESLWLARAMDHVEVWLREAAKWCIKRWKSAGWPVRGVIILIAAALAAGAAWLAYQMMFAK